MSLVAEICNFKRITANPLTIFAIKRKAANFEIGN
jgi:hypothetical protein